MIIDHIWLFFYERYNGILENFPSNSRSIEIQLMQKFVQESALYTSCQYLPEEFASDFSDIFSSHVEPALQGSLHATIHRSFHKRFDPRQLKDWTLAVLCKDESVSFLKCYWISD